jgi:hypothetical protein
VSEGAFSVDLFRRDAETVEGYRLKEGQGGVPQDCMLKCEEIISSERSLERERSWRRAVRIHPEEPSNRECWDPSAFLSTDASHSRHESRL